MQTSIGFERGVFTAARVVGLAVAIIGLIGVVLAAAIFAGALKRDGQVAYDDVSVAAVAEGQAGENDRGVRSVTANDLPPRVAEYLGDEENLEVVSRWLNNLPTDAARSDFLNNLEKIVKEAEKRGDDVIDVINAYHGVKLDRIKASPYAEYEGAVHAVTAALVLAISLAVLVGAALLLVLLAIERNTRPSHLQN